MLCKSKVKQCFKFSQVLYSIVTLLYISVQLSLTLPVPSADYTTATMLTDNLTNSSINDDLYIIKAVIYEIGILTDTNNTTDNTTERQEEIKIAFYNPPDINNGP